MKNLMSLNNLVDHLIRPPKFTYSINDLGSIIFQIKNIIYQRIDFCVKSQNNKIIQASLWKRKDTKVDQKYPNPFLIYLHCNCGSRVQGMQLLHKSLQLGYNFIAYDSRGCGQSQGQYISLGYHQILDLEVIIKYIVDNYVINPQIVLWGRSMGAVTSINFLANNNKYINNIKVAVLDSPFINLKEVICQIVNKKVGAPKLLIDLFVSYLQPIVQQKAKFKISQFDLRKQINKIKCPLILMASKSDQLVPFKHLQQIYDSHKGKKSIFYLSQSHIEQRSNQTIQKVFKTIQRYFLAQRKNEETTMQTIANFTKTGADTFDLKNYRFTQFSQMKNNLNIGSNKKSKSSKKITITYPFSTGKIQSTNKIQLFQQKEGFNMQFSKTQSKKKKLLSLNCSKTSIKSNSQINSTIKTNCRPIQLFKSFERKNQLSKRDENKSNINLILKQKCNMQIHNSLIHQIENKKQGNENIIKGKNGHKRTNSNISTNRNLNKQNSIRKIVSQFTQTKQVKRDVRILNIFTKIQ